MSAAAPDDALGDQEAARQLQIVPRRAHDHRQRDAAHLDLERLLARHGVDRLTARVAVEAPQGHGAQGVGRIVLGAVGLGHPARVSHRRGPDNRPAATRFGPGRGGFRRENRGVLTHSLNRGCNAE